jgi:hypothetical protein
LPSRSEIRNRHSRFLQIKNSSTPKTPLRARSSATVRNAVSGSESNGRPRIPGPFHSSTSIRSNAAYVEAFAWAGKPAARSSTSERPCAGVTLMERGVVGMQSRELRTNNHVLACLFYSPAGATGSRLARGRYSPAPHLDPANAKPAQMDGMASHSPRKGVLSAQRNS